MLAEPAVRARAARARARAAVGRALVRVGVREAVAREDGRGAVRVRESEDVREGVGVRGRVGVQVAGVLRARAGTSDVKRMWENLKKKEREGGAHAFGVVVRDEDVGVVAGDPSSVVEVLEVGELGLVGKRVSERIREAEPGIA